MSLRCRGLAALVLGTALAFGLAGGSVFYYRHHRTEVGNACPQTAANPGGLCYANLPSGGWPFSYLRDSADTSIVNSLGPEDHFEPGLFLLDVAFYGVLIAGGPIVLSRLRRRSANP